MKKEFENIFILVKKARQICMITHSKLSPIPFFSPLISTLSSNFFRHIFCIYKVGLDF